MTDIHLHAQVVHIHLDQSPTEVPVVSLSGPLDPDKVAEQIRSILARRRRDGGGSAVPA